MYVRMSEPRKPTHQTAHAMDYVTLDMEEQLSIGFGLDLFPVVLNSYYAILYFI